MLNKNTNVKESIDKFIVHVYNKHIEMSEEERSRIRSDLTESLRQAPEERKRKEQQSS